LALRRHDAAYASHQELSNLGFIVISTPYDLTFDHATCAYRTATALDDCLAQLCITPVGAPVVEGFQQLPLYALGHSNGSLLHLLAGRCAPHRPCFGWTPRMRRAGETVMDFRDAHPSKDLRPGAAERMERSCNGVEDHGALTKRHGARTESFRRLWKAGSSASSAPFSAPSVPSKWSRIGGD
jgi:hypothetical protein